MTPLIQFLLKNIGVPVVALLIKEFQAKNNNVFPTAEQVAQMFIDEPAKWINQGTAWLAANPSTTGKS